MISRPGARGVTLVELLVVLVLLGIMAGVVGLTLQTAQPVVAIDPIYARVAAARDSAIRSGHSVTVHLTTIDATDATAYPDGRVIATRTLDIDPLGGGVDVAH
ncbi:MAG TPA: prepilin-type N-terminal cleavage/methylation domain-containing protein [Gemmatimonadaceae bacterium]